MKSCQPDHQHLAEALLDCATLHSKGSSWSDFLKHGKARTIMTIRVESGLDLVAGLAKS